MSPPCPIYFDHVSFQLFLDSSFVGCLPYVFYFLPSFGCSLLVHVDLWQNPFSFGLQVFRLEVEGENDCLGNQPTDGCAIYV